MPSGPAMVYLKKYFTEGLIQVAILLSLVGDKVDVGTYLPPWHGMILGPTSALTQAQLHNLRNHLDGQDVNPKAVDLEGFFTARRLLGWVRSLDHLQLPSSELETWLVRREADAMTMGTPGQSAPLDGGPGGLEDHPGESLELGYGPIRENSVDAMVATPRRGQEEDEEELFKEDTENNLLEYSDNGYYERPERAQEDDRRENEELVGDPRRESWRDGGRNYDLTNRELADDLSDQFESLEAQSSMSLQECLQLWEGTFSFGEEPECPDSVDLGLRQALTEDPSLAVGPLLSPLLSREDPSLDMEQQWQDILAIMEPEDMDVDISRGDVPQFGSTQSYGLIDHVHQDVSLHQAILPENSYSFSPSFEDSVHLEAPLRPSQLSQSPSGPNTLPLTLGSSYLIENELPLAVNGSFGNPIPSLQSSLFPEDAVLPAPLLEDVLLDEISFLTLALEEGFNPTQASELEEELDSDSGLSLNFSHSPASPTGSEASSYSSSSSSSSSSESSVFSDEGAMGYNSDVDAILEPEEGAVGGYTPEVSKMCSTSYQKPDRFNTLPWLEHVGHDHTYHQPKANSPTQGKSLKPQKSRYSKPYQRDISDKLWGRDERRARALKIPFSNDLIVNLPVEEFNELLTKHGLTEAQLNLIRDIRRRGKNKMAAQNCRRRKLDILFGLEEGVDGLRRQKARLLKEQAENLRSMREMKHRISVLYQEVFSHLQDEQGRPLPSTDYTLQFGSNGRVLLATNRGSTSEQPKAHKKQDRKK
ncbi:hypothetical protein UPYG_G00093100 [Umbra pygmaea]|uniref:Endoplasmic reticulum membrane sensor NFE2L1 n=1 Tax=Umbra pygmaea TaxID=75934 RepID=A0ABD0X3B1_UMBPY